ncbi:unnamed protein product [Symbiodinium sp. KB8]|nr:unnamed protein product [Symbiodinium sp. KB8]
MELLFLLLDASIPQDLANGAGCIKNENIRDEAPAAWTAERQIVLSEDAVADRETSAAGRCQDPLRESGRAKLEHAAVQMSQDPSQESSQPKRAKVEHEAVQSQMSQDPSRESGQPKKPKLEQPAVQPQMSQDVHRTVKQVPDASTSTGHSPLPEALPACVRAPWEVFHEECVKHKTRVLRDLSARDAYAAFGVLNAQTRFQYASVSTDELASYLYYRDIMFQVRKPDNWGELSCDERDDFMPNNVWMFLTDLVRREPEASILMPELDFSFVLQGMPAEPGPLLGWERLEPAVLEVFQALASKLPLALGASLGPVLARLQLKKEEQQEPARELDQQSCLDIERQLLRPYVSEQVKLDEPMSWGMLLRSLVQLGKEYLGELWVRCLCITLASNEQTSKLMQMQVACCVDGKQREATQRLAEAFLVLAQEQDGCKYVLQRMPVAPQDDEWSCGHRIICTLDRLLAEKTSSSDWPLSLEPATYSRANMLKVIDGMSDDPEGRMIQDLAVVARAAEAASASEGPVVDRPDQESALVQDYRAGIKMLLEKGITFNQTFQQQRHENKLPMDKGHWRDFVVAVKRDTAIKNCLACSSLRDRCLMQGQADEQAQPIQDGGRVYSGEGRPRRTDQRETLQTMLARDRPGVYEHLRTSWFWCSWCQKECNFQRLWGSGMKYVKDHEKAQCHRQPGDPAAALAGRPSTCQGVEVGSGTCPSLDRVEHAVVTWLLAGLIQCKVTDPFSPCYSHCITWRDDKAVVKSSFCKGFGGSPCDRCFKQASSNHFINEVVHWATRIHMVTYVTTLAEGTEQERVQAKEKLMSTDIYTTREGRREVDKLLGYENVVAAIGYVKRLMESIPRSKLTVRLSSWLELHVRRLLRTPVGCEKERTAMRLLTKCFAEKVLQGDILEDQLLLASRVLSGELQADRVVSSLMLSFMDMQQRLREGKKDRVCSSRRLDEETMQELICTLGNSRESRDLLRYFGVCLGERPRVNFNVSLLPEFFASPRNMDVLRQAVRSVLPLLGCTNGCRNWFISIDETYYTPSWQLISGLQGDGRLIVGGHWGECQDTDFSALPSAEDTPDDGHLSRMTLDFIACSTLDCSKAWHLAMLPMPMGADNGKAVLQLRVLDAIMHAATLENGCPPLGISTDAGSINTLTQDLFLGYTDALQDAGELKFFNKCTAVSLQYLPYCIWRHLKFQDVTSSHNFLGVLDCLHGLKRYTYHHFTSTRCVLWGAWFSTCWPTLHAGGGISRKAYTLQDTMSDEQPLCPMYQRVNPRHLDDGWATGGLHVYMLLSALLSGCCEGANQLSKEIRFINATCAYALLLLGVWNARKRFGQTWASWFIPMVSVRNLCQLAVQQMAACIAKPADTAVLPGCFQEKQSEYHYSRLKMPYRGTPSVRDAIVGVQLLHCKQLRNHKPPTPEKDMDLAGLDCKDAKILAGKCWNSTSGGYAKEKACSQRSDPSSFTTAELQEDDQAWEDHLEDMMEAMDALDEDGGEVREDDDSSQLASLLASEDHLKAKRELQALTEAMGEEQPTAEPLPLPSSETLDQAVVSEIADLGDEIVKEPTLLSVMKPLLDCPAFEVQATEGTTAVLQRMTALRPEIRKLVLAMRLRERYLSHACLTGTSKTECSWHREQHRLAIARARSLISGARNSRQQSWWQVQQQVTGTSLPETVDTDWKLRPLTVLRPPEPGSGQVVMCKLPRPDAIGKPQEIGMFLVTDVFRGAVFKRKGSDAKRRQCNRPSPAALPWTAVSSVRLVPLQRVSDHQWACCSFTEPWAADPVETVVAEVRVGRQGWENDHFVVRIEDTVIEEIEALAAQPEKWVAKKSPAAESGDKDDPKMYCVQDFAKSNGGKNLVAFLRGLPEQYAKAKLEFDVPNWESTCLRSVDYFDTIQPTAVGKAYGRGTGASLAAENSQLLRLLFKVASNNGRMKASTKECVNSMPLAATWPQKVEVMARSALGAMYAGRRLLAPSSEIVGNNIGYRDDAPIPEVPVMCPEPDGKFGRY